MKKQFIAPELANCFYLFEPYLHMRIADYVSVSRLADAGKK